ncbi:MAG: hypothetical protein WEA61_01690 [Anaerolineales bacterium]
MGIHEIEQAISHLSPDELARFRAWYEEFDAQIWDDQFEADAKSGKLGQVAEKAIEEYRTGKAKEL